MLLGSALLSAAPLTVASYDMLNGEKHTWSYMDKTYNGSGDRTVGLSPLSGGKGILTDGMVGADNIGTDLGNGPAYEWVAWALSGGGFSPPDPNDTNATITFKLTSPADINSISIFANNMATPVSGCYLFASATVSFSNDDVNFVNPITYTTTDADRANTSARYITIALNQSTPEQYVQVHLTHQSIANWLAIAEVTFDGTVPGQASTPEPTSAMLGGLGLLGLAWKLRRRSRSA